MNPEELTNLLAKQVLGWTVAPERFLTGDRGWLPRWRFAPLANLDQAFVLLDKAGSSYTLAVSENGRFHAEVRIGDSIGKASGEPKAKTITLALAAALKLEVEDGGHAI